MGYLLQQEVNTITSTFGPLSMKVTPFLLIGLSDSQASSGSRIGNQEGLEFLWREEHIK